MHCSGLSPGKLYFSTRYMEILLCIKLLLQPIPLRCQAASRLLIPTSPHGTQSSPSGTRNPTAAIFRQPLSITQQITELENFDRRSLPAMDLSSWPKIHIKGRSLVQETWLAKMRPRRSWITAHGTFLVEVSPTGKSICNGH